MNVLTADLISVIVTRSYSIIKHMHIPKYSYEILLYKDQNGKNHRTDAPAIISNDNMWTWCYRGKRHRDIKPALRLYSGYKWYIMGKFIAKRKK